MRKLPNATSPHVHGLKLDLGTFPSRRASKGNAALKTPSKSGKSHLAGKTSLSNSIKLAAWANLPTRYGKFVAYAFVSKSGEEQLALVYGDVYGKSGVPARVHSQCLTGDALGSLKCDCGPQLDAALSYISRHGFGILIYLAQEGRGIGLANKIFAYHLQDHGLDTVEANRVQGLPIDARDFSDAASILRMLGVKSVALLTNNPKKVASLKRNGVPVARRIPLELASNKYNRGYLEVKKRKLGHLLKQS